MFHQERNINSLKCLDTPHWIYIFYKKIVVVFSSFVSDFYFCFPKKMELIHVEESFEIVMNESEIVMK
jgi:hypothetical protein